MLEEERYEDDDDNRLEGVGILETGNECVAKDADWEANEESEIREKLEIGDDRRDENSMLEEER